MAFENHSEISRILVLFRTFQNSYLSKSILIGIQSIFLSSYFFGVDVAVLGVCFDVARKLIPTCSLF